MRWFLRSIVLGTLGVLAMMPAVGATTPLPNQPVGLTSPSVATLSLFAGANGGNNRFGEVLATTGNRWVLDTPEGIATNGGILMALSGARVTAAMLPSQLLRFTPLAQADALGPFSPDFFGGAAVAAPSALSTGASTTALLVAGNRLAVKTGSRSWSVRSVAVAAAVAKACGGSLSAVALVRPDRIVDGTILGHSCSGPTWTPFTTAGGHALAVAGLGRSPSLQLLRLVATPTGALALVQTPTRGLVVLTYSSGSWFLSATLDAHPGVVRATAIGPRGQVAALVIDHGTERVVRTGSLAPCTVAGTWSAVAFTPSGSLNLFSVVNHPAHQLPSLVTVAALSGNHLTVTEQLGIDVPYGSSA